MFSNKLKSLNITLKLLFFRLLFFPFFPFFAFYLFDFFTPLLLSSSMYGIARSSPLYLFRRFSLFIILGVMTSIRLLLALPRALSPLLIRRHRRRRRPRRRCRRHSGLFSLILYEERAFAIKTKYYGLIEPCKPRIAEFFVVFA